MAIVDIDGAHTELKRHPRAGTVLVLAAVFALILVYLRPLAYLTNYWNKPEYGHGYLIPVIAFFLGWHDLTRFQLRASASWSGIGWLIFGLVFLVIGQLSAFNAASVYGFIIALIGLSHVVCWRQSNARAFARVWHFIFRSSITEPFISGFVHANAIDLLHRGE